jgi:DNA-directed RNA polymerase subunit RPC12/RpoP
MLLKCKCPKCGEAKEYLAEQVGTPLDCFRCGHRFLLQNNPVRVTWQIISATLAVLVIIGGICARVYLRAERWGAFDRHTPAVSFQFGDHDDDDDDR